jgi:hypothetical protein
MQFLCNRSISEEQLVEYLREGTGVMIASLYFPCEEAELFLFYNRYGGDFPVGALVGFPQDSLHSIDQEGFCTFLAIQEQCVVLLDMATEDEQYLMITPDGPSGVVHIQLDGEHISAVRKGT